MPAIPEPPGRFGDALIELRPIAEWDIPEVLIAHQDDRELHRRRGMAKPPTGAQLGREVERAPERRLSGDSIELTIVEPGSNDCRGRVEIFALDWEELTASVRVWVAPQLRDRGLEQRAAELATQWLRSAVGLHDLDVTLLT